MSEDKKQADWQARMRAAAQTPWDNIPEIGLYMDQVVGYLNRQLGFLTEDEEPLLSSSMVNNYVKGGQLSRPQKKRYDRTQLAELYMLCSLKQVLSIDEAAVILHAMEENDSPEELYRAFLSRQKDACLDCAERVAGEAESERLQLALTLALQASVYRAAARRLIEDAQSDDVLALKRRKLENRAAAKAVRAEAKAKKAKAKPARSPRPKTKTKTKTKNI